MQAYISNIRFYSKLRFFFLKKKVKKSKNFNMWLILEHVFIYFSFNLYFRKGELVHVACVKLN